MRNANTYIQPAEVHAFQFLRKMVFIWNPSASSEPCDNCKISSLLYNPTSVPSLTIRIRDDQTCRFGGEGCHILDQDRVFEDLNGRTHLILREHVWQIFRYQMLQVPLSLFFATQKVHSPESQSICHTGKDWKQSMVYANWSGVPRRLVGEVYLEYVGQRTSSCEGHSKLQS